MRKLSKLAFIIFVPIVLGVGLIVSGNYFRNDAVAQAGRFVLSIGIPVTAISIVVVGIILIVTGKASDVKGPDGFSLFQNAQADFGGSDGAQDTGEEAPCKDDAPSPAEAESERLEEINSARGYESQLKYEQYQMDHSAEAYRLSDKKSRVKGWLLLGFLLTCFVLVLVFAFFRLYVGAIVC
ncbi:MAG: hypothetical protein K2L72_01935, partial [Clostridia bacterium]|nr:hypothetical protein [Clostridia bacterium]